MCTLKCLYPNFLPETGLARQTPTSLRGEYEECTGWKWSGLNSLHQGRATSTSKFDKGKRKTISKEAMWEKGWFHYQLGCSCLLEIFIIESTPISLWIYQGLIPLPEIVACNTTGSKLPVPKQVRMYLIWWVWNPATTQGRWKWQGYGGYAYIFIMKRLQAS